MKNSREKSLKKLYIFISNSIGPWGYIDSGFLTNEFEWFIKDVTLAVTLEPWNVSEIMWPLNEYDSDLIWMFYQNGNNFNRKCAQFGQSYSFIFAFHIVLRISEFKFIIGHSTGTMKILRIFFLFGNNSEIITKWL